MATRKELEYFFSTSVTQKVDSFCYANTEKMEEILVLERLPNFQPLLWSEDVLKEIREGWWGRANRGTIRG